MRSTGCRRKATSASCAPRPRAPASRPARETPSWDLETYPILTWSWRPREFPKGADERTSGTNDSVLAVYVAVPYSKIRGPKAVKYVWSEKVPVGTRLESNGGLTQVRVLRSGVPVSRDAWVEERVNALQEWKAAFKESSTPKVGGIVVLTDSDDTQVHRERRLPQLPRLSRLTVARTERAAGTPPPRTIPTLLTGGANRQPRGGRGAGRKRAQGSSSSIRGVNHTQSNGSAPPYAAA